jgi:hypothetical protein
MARLISTSPNSHSSRIEEDSTQTNQAIFVYSLEDFLRSWPKSALIWTDLPPSPNGPERLSVAKRAGFRSRLFAACTDPLNQPTPAPMPLEPESLVANSTGTVATTLEAEEECPPVEISRAETQTRWTPVPQSERQSPKPINRNIALKVAATNVPSRDTWRVTVPIGDPGSKRSQKLQKQRHLKSPNYLTSRTERLWPITP